VARGVDSVAPMARLILKRPEAPAETIHVGGLTTLGGGLDDVFVVPGLPAALLSLEPAPQGDLVVVEAHADGAHVGSRLLRRGSRRLLRPGDEVELVGGTRLVAPRTAVATEGEVDATRALAGAMLAEAAAGMAPSAGPRLLVLEGPDAGGRLAISDGLVLGRGCASDLRLADARISRAHVRFALRDGQVSLRDLGSKNGLTVNARRARRGVALVAGDVVEIGGTLLAFEPGVEGPPAHDARARSRAAGSESPALGARRGVAWAPALAGGALLAAAAALCLAAGT
jgi:hypothetical protein